MKIKPINKKIDKLLNRALDEISAKPEINTANLKNIVTAYRTMYHETEQDYTGDVYIIDNVPKSDE